MRGRREASSRRGHGIRPPRQAAAGLSPASGDASPGDRLTSMQWQFWIIQTLNSVAFGGLLFLLSSGFSLIFGLMRIPNLAHGAFFMLGAYFGYSLLARGGNFWLVAVAAGLGVGIIGILLERLVLRQISGNEQGQVLVTLGVSFIIADICLLVWTGDPMPLPAPAA